MSTVRSAGYSEWELSAARGADLEAREGVRGVVNAQKKPLVPIARRFPSLLDKGRKGPAACGNGRRAEIHGSGSRGQGQGPAGRLRGRGCIAAGGRRKPPTRRQAIEDRTGSGGTSQPNPGLPDRWGIVLDRSEIRSSIFSPLAHDRPMVTGRPLPWPSRVFQVKYDVFDLSADFLDSLRRSMIDRRLKVREQSAKL